MDTLFGGTLPGAMRFIIAFVVVMALITVCAWLARRFSSGRLAAGTSRGRQPRLALIDSATVDARRRLVLVRRDNVEHLVMIGGPTDLVIEQNIVRASAETVRDRAPARMATARSEPIAASLPMEDGSVWPLQPEAEPVHRVRAEPAIQNPPEPQPAVQKIDIPARDPVVDGGKEAAPERDTAVVSGAPLEASAVESSAIPAAPATDPTAPNAESESERHRMAIALQLDAALGRPARHEPRLDIPASEIRAPQTEPMAESPQAQRPDPVGEIRPGKNRQFYESLEQEMASLLGRPTGKT